MPNSYAVAPGVVPGNLTVAGTLAVQGNSITLGVADPIVRLFKTASNGAVLSSNLQTDLATRDNTGVSAFALQLVSPGSRTVLQRLNVAGTSRTEAFWNSIFTAGVQTAHTGTTTEDTIFTAPVRGKTLINNGYLRLQSLVNVTVQGATAGTVRLRFGGVLIGAASITATGAFSIDLLLSENGVTNQQICYMTVLSGTAVVALVRAQIAVDDTVDENLTVTFQSGATTDSQTFEFCDVQQVATSLALTG